MLQSELEIKNKQITQHGELISKQMELINGLSERLREGNILIGGLQRQLALPEGRERRAENAVTVESPTPSSPPQQKARKAAADPPKKKGFLTRLFR